MPPRILNNFLYRNSWVNRVESHFFCLGIESQYSLGSNHSTGATTFQPNSLSPIPSISKAWRGPITPLLHESAFLVFHNNDKPFGERCDITPPATAG